MLASLPALLLAHRTPRAYRTNPRRTFRGAAALIPTLAVLLLAGLLPVAPATAEDNPAGPSSSSSSGTTSTPGKVGQNRATFGIAPATPKYPDNRTFFGYRFAANTSYTDHVALLNYAAKPVTLTVYAADLSNNSDGTLAVGLKDAKPTDAGGWVTVRHAPSVTLPAASKRGPGLVVIPFTITVPAKAVPGDHGAAVVASLASISRNKDSNNVKLDQRIATRVLIRVAGPLVPGLSVRGLSPTYRPTLNPAGTGSARVSYTITNTGNTILGARQSATIKGLFGRKITVPDAEAPEIPLLLPGKSATVSFVASGVRPWFTEKVTISLTPLVQASDQASVHVAPVSATASFSAIPWPAIAVVAGVILLILLLLIFRRYRRRRARSAHSPKHDPRTSGPNRPAPDLQVV